MAGERALGSRAVKTALPLALVLLVGPALAHGEDAPPPPPPPAPSEAPQPAAPPAAPVASAPAAPPGAAPATGSPLGLVLQAGIGGGGTVGGGSEYTPHGLFEGEVVAGWEAGMGIRPELGVVFGIAPRGHLALRPGVRYSPPELPFFLRGALDISTYPGGWRWFLLGGGAEVRLTDVLGGFAEADAGIPLARNVGLGLLLRAGVSFRF
jgi:hypothetical protein